MSSAFDNIVAAAEGQSDVPLPAPFDMVAILGVRGGINSVVARPEIDGFAGIKGKVVAVDAAKSGYAIVLYQILLKNGLTYGKDYTSVAVGSTANRARRAGGRPCCRRDDRYAERQAAAEARLQNPRRCDAMNLAPIRAVPLSCGGRGQRITNRNSPPLSVPMSAATDYIFAHRDEAIAELKKHVKDMSDDELGTLYDKITGPGGLDRHAASSISPASRTC